MPSASKLFNSFASEKNFKQVGNRVTSTQPGKPFASAEALNYIPTGYNTSGGNMFKYGALASSLVKRAEGTIGRKLTNLDKVQFGALVEEAAITGEPFMKQFDSLAFYKANGGTPSLDTVSPDVTRGGRSRLVDAREMNRELNGGPSRNLEGDVYSDPVRSKDISTGRGEFEWGKNKYPDQYNKRADPLKVLGDNMEKYRELVKDVGPFEATKIFDNAQFKQNKVSPNNELMSPKDISDMKNNILKPREPRDQKSKLGATTKGTGGGWDALSSSFSVLSPGQKWALGGAGAVAAVGAAGMAYSSATNSKRNPMGSAVGAAATIGIIGAGIKGASHAMMKEGMAGISNKAVRKASTSRIRSNPLLLKKFSSMKTPADKVSFMRKINKGMHSRMGAATKQGQFSKQLNTFAPNWKAVGGAAALGGMAVGGLGMGRNMSGI